MTDLLALLLDPLLSYGFMRQALLVAVAVGLVSAVLSCLLVVRHQALLGDAISHAVLLGVALGFLVAGVGGLLPGALLVAVLTGLAITYLERNTPVKLDAAMGICFTATFALGLAIISVAQPRGIDLFHVLFGNIIGIHRSDVILTLAAGLAVLAIVIGLFRWLHLWSFDPLLAEAMGVRVRLVEYVFTALLSATIVASMKAVGLLLVVAMLIIPGATALLVTSRLRTMMVVAGGVGVLAAVAGLYASFYVDVASGPAIVLTAAAVFGLALLVAPEHGILPRIRARRRRAMRVVSEDLLKWLVRPSGEAAPVSPVALAGALDVPIEALRRAVRRLVRDGLLERDDGRVGLTAGGRRRALAVVRAHRLLEQHAREVERAPLSEVHTIAEHREHEVDSVDLDDMAYVLGDPAVDPHGHPIPRGRGRLAADALRPLGDARPGDTGTVAMLADDRDDLVIQMIRLGLLPGSRVRVLGGTDEHQVVEIDGRPVTVPAEVVQRVFLDAPRNG